MADENQQKIEQETRRGRRAERVEEEAGDLGRRGFELSFGEGPHALINVAMRLNAFAKDNSEALAHTLNVSTKGLLDAHGEVLHFADMRLNKGMDHIRTLMSTRDVGEAIGQQSGYLRESVQDYVEQAQSLFEMGVRITREGWTPIQQRSEDVTRGIQRVAAE